MTADTEQAGAQAGGVEKITLAVADEMRFHMENAHEGVCRLSPSVIAGWRRHLADRMRGIIEAAPDDEEYEARPAPAPVDAGGLVAAREAMRKCIAGDSVLADDRVLDILAKAALAAAAEREHLAASQA